MPDFFGDDSSNFLLVVFLELFDDSTLEGFFGDLLGESCVSCFERVRFVFLGFFDGSTFFGDLVELFDDSTFFGDFAGLFEGFAFFGDLDGLFEGDNFFGDDSAFFEDLVGLFEGLAGAFFFLRPRPSCSSSFHLRYFNKSSSKFYLN